jgi:hypothetical protein
VANQVFLTVLSGTAVYIIGQLALKMAIEPLHDLRETIGLISHSLIERASVIYNPSVGTPEDGAKTFRELKKLASRLHCHLYVIPLYPVMAWTFRLPPRVEIMAASMNLSGLANGVRSDPNSLNHEFVEKIRKSLKIYDIPK